MIRVQKSLSVAALGFLLKSCIPMPHSTGAGGGQHNAPAVRGLSEFFVGPGCTQYFLQPQEWEGPRATQLELDLTVRDSLSNLRLCRLMVSVTGAQPRSAADTLLISSPGGKLLPLVAPQVIFTQPKDKQITSRLELSLTPAQVKAWLTSEQPQLIVANPQGQRLRFQPGRRAGKRFQALRMRLFGS